MDDDWGDPYDSGNHLICCLRIKANVNVYVNINIHVFGSYHDWFNTVLLVGGWATSLKNMNVNGDDEIANIWEIENGNQTTNQYII